MDSSLLTMLLIFVVMWLALQFFLVRPARAKQQAAQAAVEALDAGARVMLTSGIYGTIRHLGERQAIIEIAPGVDLTVEKAAIAKPVDPADEEFEYEDEVDEVDAPAANSAGATISAVPVSGLNGLDQAVGRLSGVDEGVGGAPDFRAPEGR